MIIDLHLLICSCRREPATHARYWSTSIKHSISLIHIMLIRISFRRQENRKERSCHNIFLRNFWAVGICTSDICARNKNYFVAVQSIAKWWRNIYDNLSFFFIANLTIRRDDGTTLAIDVRRSSSNYCVLLSSTTRSQSVGFLYSFRQWKLKFVFACTSETIMIFEFEAQKTPFTKTQWVRKNLWRISL